jgi:WD40 repeat protein
VIAVAYSKNKVISASTDKTIKIWDIKTGLCEKTIEAHSEPIRAIQMIETNQFISCSSDKSILLWDLNTFNCLKTFLAHSDQIYW